MAEKGRECVTRLLDGRIKVWMHVADPTSIVQPGSIVDREATGEQVNKKIGAESLATGGCNSAALQFKLGGYSEWGFCIQSDGVSLQLEYKASNLD